MFAASTADRTREQRIRRMADRQGFALRKSRVRDPYSPVYGQWWLLAVAVWNGARWEPVASPDQTHDAWLGPFADLDEVEARLRGERS